MITIALDAMGGDNQPISNIDGALLALSKREDLIISLIGKEDILKPILDTKTYDKNRLIIVPASEVIETGEPPVMAFQKKKDSSLLRGFELIRKKTCQGFVSAGSTGAILVGAQLLAGRLKNVKRAPLCVEIPTIKGTSLLIDCGANVDAKPESLCQFAVMGTIYAREFLGIKDPTVGLINIGTEEEKGNELTRTTFPLLKNLPGIHFVGNTEARDVPYGVADIYVAEAFTGNVILKMYEGVAKALISEIKGTLKESFIGSLGGLMIKKPLRKLLKKFDSSEDGGAPLLGLTGLVMKAHGNSSALQIKNAILQCAAFAEKNLTEKLEKALSVIGSENNNAEPMTKEQPVSKNVLKSDTNTESKKTQASSLEQKIGYTFRDKNLLTKALTHTSYIHEEKLPYTECNERLEFFGDAILERTVTQYLFDKYKSEPEGDLTKRRASLVCEDTLAYAARKISLGDSLKLGKGADKGGGRDSDNVLSDAMEALLAAIYLDGSPKDTDRLIYDYILSEDKEILPMDAKSELQERMQKEGKTVAYREISESGPDHDKAYLYEVLINDKPISKGSGHSKKEAQNNAAIKAIENMQE